MKSNIFMAVMAAGISFNVSALELGEFNGTTFSVGGYVKAEGIFTDPEEGGSIDFEGSARESRINFTASKTVEGHEVTGFIEGDFWGGSGGSYDLRLRHAYLQVDNLTVGQTWNGQFWAMVPYDALYFDFFNAGKGTPAGNGAVVRPDVVMHYQAGDFRLTLQEPINDEAAYPDFVVNYAKSFEGGHGFSVAVTGRDVAKSSTTTSSEDSEFGAALLLAGKYTIGNTTLHLNGYTGKGQAAYSGFGYGGAWAPGVDKGLDANADGELITTTGLVAAVTHRFTDKLTGVARYAQVEADETAAGYDDTMDITLVNLVYNYLPGLDFGIEWRDQNVETFPGLRPSGQQVEVMAMYKF